MGVIVKINQSPAVEDDAMTCIAPGQSELDCLVDDQPSAFSLGEFERVEGVE